MTPQEALARLEAAAGRALTSQEIEQAKGMLPAGWEAGISDAALQPLLQKATALKGSGLLTGGSMASPPVTYSGPTLYPGDPGYISPAPIPRRSGCRTQEWPWTPRGSS